MGTFSITYDDTKAAEIANYVGLAKGYTGFKPDGSAETKAQFVRRMIAEQVKDWVAVGKRIEAEQAVNEAVYRETLGIS